MQSGLKCIALPVETKVRELNGKVWLAGNLALRGYRVAFGELSVLKKNIERIRPDIYIGDSAVYRDSRLFFYKKLKAAGVVVLVHDTEGALYYSPALYLKRLNSEILQHVDLYLAWGSAAADIFLQNLQGIDTQVAVSGSPTFDLLSPRFRQFYDEDVARLKNKYGDFILINTKFGRVNHFNSRIDEKKLIYNDPDIPRFQQELFQHFFTAIRTLADTFQKNNIIIRPHPSENHDTYRRAFQTTANIIVEHSLSVHPWALAAKAVIHNGCTTGIESVLLGRPVVAYRPVVNEKVDVFLPNYVSHEVFSLEELVEVIGSYLEKNGEKTDKALSLDQMQALEYHFHLLDGNATIRFCDAIDAFKEHSIGGARDWSMVAAAKSPTLLCSLKSVKQKILGLAGGRDSLRQDNVIEKYGKQKFDSLSASEIEQCWEKLDPKAKGEHRLSVVPIESALNCFWVSKEI